jgi:hypothetical protein
MINRCIDLLVVRLRRGEDKMIIEESICPDSKKLLNIDINFCTIQDPRERIQKTLSSVFLDSSMDIKYRDSGKRGVGNSFSFKINSDNDEGLMTIVNVYRMNHGGPMRGYQVSIYSLGIIDGPIKSISEKIEENLWNSELHREETI